jgi:hypothetical protein
MGRLQCNSTEEEKRIVQYDVTVTAAEVCRLTEMQISPGVARHGGMVTRQENRLYYPSKNAKRLIP